MPGAAARHHAVRILDIDFTTDNSDNDIFEVDAVTYYRDAQSRAAGNGFVPDAQQSASEGGALSDLNAGADLATNEAWIWFSEAVPPVSVIILDQATQA